MFQTQAKQIFVTGALAVAGVLAGVSTAEAGPFRVKFDPDYGAPFNVAGNQLGWKGEAIFDDGTCTALGWISNLPGSCNGQLTFTSATVELYNSATPGTTFQTLNFTGGEVAWVFRTALDPTPPVALVSSPFTPVQGSTDYFETYYDDYPAYFSLVFVGEQAQLFWFKNNPGNALSSAAAALMYASCAQPGVNSVFGNECGLSQGGGANLVITVVPEPATYGLLLAGLGAVAMLARRRQRATPAA